MKIKENIFPILCITLSLIFIHSKYFVSVTPVDKLADTVMCLAFLFLALISNSTKEIIETIGETKNEI